MVGLGHFAAGTLRGAVRLRAPANMEQAISALDPNVTSTYTRGEANSIAIPEPRSQLVDRRAGG
jgi:hypothetical protein